MPLALQQEGNGFRVSQTFEPPVVYFDHWAICEFSDSVVLQDRLVSALKKRGGTLLLSHTNLAEFTSAEDKRYTEAAEAFLDRLIPHLYLTDFDLEKAEAFEADPVNSGQRLCPSADLPMLKYLATQSVHAGEGLTFRGFMAPLYEFRGPLNETFKIVSQNILNELNSQRSDPKFIEKARASAPSNRRSKIRVILGELIRELILDSNATITINDVVDWQHAVLPISCCDFVLLDRKWAQRVLNFSQRATTHNFEIHLAQCFSKRENGLERFLQELEVICA